LAVVIAVEDDLAVIPCFHGAAFVQQVLVRRAIERCCSYEAAGCLDRQQGQRAPGAVTGQKDVIGVHKGLRREILYCGEHVIYFVIEEGESTLLAVLTTEHRRHHHKAFSPIGDGHVPIRCTELEASVEKDDGGQFLI